MAKRFRKVRKTKGGTPKRYLAGVKNKKKAEREIKRTAKLYKAGKLTPAMMNEISRKRAARGKKKKKKR
jgi:hypothetical protein